MEQFSNMYSKWLSILGKSTPYMEHMGYIDPSFKWHYGIDPDK